VLLRTGWTPRANAPGGYGRCAQCCRYPPDAKRRRERNSFPESESHETWKFGLSAVHRLEDVCPPSRRPTRFLNHPVVCWCWAGWRQNSATGLDRDGSPGARSRRGFSGRQEPLGARWGFNGSRSVPNVGLRGGFQYATRERSGRDGVARRGPATESASSDWVEEGGLRRPIGICDGTGPGAVEK
jgi:hypothetical protein